VSAKVVSRTSLVCDTCGFEHLALVADATMARVAAAADGWKYIKYDRIASTAPSKGGRGSPRSWDACPSCDIPPTPEAALETRNNLGAPE
jgi:hypothetical protein